MTDEVREARTELNKTFKAINTEWYTIMPRGTNEHPKWFGFIRQVNTGNVWAWLASPFYAFVTNSMTRNIEDETEWPYTFNMSSEPDKENLFDLLSYQTADAPFIDGNMFEMNATGIDTIVGYLESLIKSPLNDRVQIMSSEKGVLSWLKQAVSMTKSRRNDMTYRMRYASCVSMYPSKRVKGMVYTDGFAMPVHGDGITGENNFVNVNLNVAEYAMKLPAKDVSWLIDSNGEYTCARVTGSGWSSEFFARNEAGANGIDSVVGDGRAFKSLTNVDGYASVSSCKIGLLRDIVAKAKGGTIGMAFSSEIVDGETKMTMRWGVNGSGIVNSVVSNIKIASDPSLHVDNRCGWYLNWNIINAATAHLDDDREVIFYTKNDDASNKNKLDTVLRVPVQIKWAGGYTMIMPLHALATDTAMGMWLPHVYYPHVYTPVVNQD